MRGVNVIQHISIWTRASCRSLMWMFGHFYFDCCTCRASSFYFTLENSHQTREEIWLICHVVLKLNLIKRMNGVQSKTSEGRGCDREIWHTSKASSEIKWASQIFCVQLTYCILAHGSVSTSLNRSRRLMSACWSWPTLPFCWWSSPFDQET